MDVYTYDVPTGVIIPETQDLLEQVQTEFQNALGSDLNLNPNTPQGMLITVEVLARTAVADNNAVIANQINPNLAGGVFLDALMALLGSFRTPATYSTVLCDITGVVGTSIPAGAQISDSNGNLFEIVSTTVIPTGGVINNILFQSVLTGAIPGISGTLTTIVSNILGWQTVTNPLDASLGSETQSDQQASLLRKNTLAAQGMGLAQSIISALYLAGINSMTFQENIADTTEVINDISMVSHSIYACINPANVTLNQVAQILTNTKNAGSAYNNGLGIPQSITITNQYSGQAIPVLFDTPSMITIYIIVTVHAFTFVGNIQTSVQQAIINYANGTIGDEVGFSVGQDVSPFQIAGAINIQVPGLFVQEVQIAKQAFTQIGTITNTMNTVTGLTYNSDIIVGMGVIGAGIPAGTTVASLVDGTGLTLSMNATLSATEILTFTQSISYQTTEIALHVWQQAQTFSSIITVNQV